MVQPLLLCFRATVVLLALTNASPSLSSATDAVSAASAADPVVHLTNVTAITDFQGALDALAAQAHVAIVAEGRPLNPHVSDDLMNSVADATVGQAITKIAAFSDDDVRRQKNGIFVLTKR